ncbi:speckle-type poz protein [Anaeramoeba flamelloides]|uniref:Speckle-type poz protein n=1 Tax=Anaeramoeba flamelloides TaxID=1746091 RepID=A0AAV7Z061_9EUKA|nr:speckle-type poz protein [Anaeramoeba flamelloides]
MTGSHDQDENNENSRLLTKITTTNEISSFETLMCCARAVVFLLNLERDYLSQDLGNLLEKGSLSDCKIQNIPVHKILIETRLGKDFVQNPLILNLLLKNDEEEEEEEEEEEDEKLPVHKFLLAARSGLFLDLFQNLDQNLNNVQDYSGKSLETLELLISFLYTDEIPITADTDQEFIKEEFEDIVDYYQLNPKIPLLDIFEKCSKK